MASLLLPESTAAGCAALLDEHGQRVQEAKPSVPVQVLGLPGVPQAGDVFAVANSEREAKDLSQRRQLIKREQDHRKLRTVTLSDLHDQIQQGHIQELRVVVKGDVDGSVEAIAEELGRITHEGSTRQRHSQRSGSHLGIGRTASGGL